jgi:hypothetical protein
MSLKLFHKIEREIMLENSCYEASIILIYQLNKDATKTKEDLRQTSLMRIGTKILTCQIQEHVKKIIIHG